MVARVLSACVHLLPSASASPSRPWGPALVWLQPLGSAPCLPPRTRRRGAPRARPLPGSLGSARLASGRVTRLFSGLPTGSGSGRSGPRASGGAWRWAVSGPGGSVRAAPAPLGMRPCSPEPKARAGPAAADATRPRPPGLGQEAAPGPPGGAAGPGAPGRAAPLSEILRLVQQGREIPGLEPLRVTATCRPPTASRLPRRPKPWESRAPAGPAVPSP
ncbi:peroxisomal biogenesis factor 39 [Macrotis lagotis]|uniref:peroxisomal biogenesis factor 39 n=1 Tax=Macrotis lagotis TaxID=92651 RepID=UPI003D68382B